MTFSRTSPSREEKNHRSPGRLKRKKLPAGDTRNRGLRNRMRRKRLITFIAVIQSFLCLLHFFLYETWTFSPAGGHRHGPMLIKLGLGFLSVSFVAASLLAYRYTNAPLRAFYRAAAVWMGMLTFLFFAAVFSWIIFGVARLAGHDVNFHRTVEVLFAAAAVAGLWRGVHGSVARITRRTVRLPAQPTALAGGTARQ